MFSWSRDFGILLQGIDLSSIVTSAAAGQEHEIIASAKRLNAAVENENDESIEKELEFLIASIPQNQEGKVMAINNNVIESSAEILHRNKATPVLVFQLLNIILSQNSLGREKLLLKTSNRPSALKLVIEALLASPDLAKVQESGFRLIKTAATKNEAVKSTFMELGGLPTLTAALQHHVHDAAVVRQAAGAIYTITNADDYSITLSKVFDTSKELAQGGILPLLYVAMRAHAAAPETLQDLFAALKGCAVQNDIVKAVMADGGLALALDALRDHMEHPGCVGRCMLLLSNLAENDDAKKELCHGAAMPLMLAAMEAHARDPRVLRAGCTAIAALSLRSADNAAALFAAGAGVALLDAMRTHPGHAELCRAATIALRNLVARNPDNRAPLLDAGAEALVRRARDTHLRCGDAAFDCLRDLGCEYGGLGDRAGRGEHSAYSGCDESLLSRPAGQAAAASAMVTWELDDS